jgi:hypothetical protein
MKDFYHVLKMLFGNYTFTLKVKTICPSKKSLAGIYNFFSKHCHIAKELYCAFSQNVCLKNKSTYPTDFYLLIQLENKIAVYGCQT